MWSSQQQKLVFYWYQDIISSSIQLKAELPAAPLSGSSHSLVQHAVPHSVQEPLFLCSSCDNCGLDGLLSKSSQQQHGKVVGACTTETQHSNFQLCTGFDVYLLAISKTSFPVYEFTVVEIRDSSYIVTWLHCKLLPSCCSLLFILCFVLTFWLESYPIT